MPRFLLFPSPLLSRAAFFEPLAAALRAAGREATTLHGIAGSNAAMIASAAQQSHRAAGDDPVILVPHSGAGPLVPSVLAGFPAGQGAVVFLDATLPHPGRARLDELREALPGGAFEDFESGLRAGGTWPNWSDEQLSTVIPDVETRRSLLELATPQPLAFFEEPLPPADLAPGMPCAYLRLSSAYDQPLAAASSRRWPTRSLDLTHFAPYTQPEEVARELIALARDLMPDS